MMKPYVPVDPDLISAQNEKSETPLHKACHQNGCPENLQKTSLAHNTDEDVLLMESEFAMDLKGLYMGLEEIFSESFSWLDDIYVNESVQAEPLLARERCSRLFTSLWCPSSILIMKPLNLFSNRCLLQDKEGRTPLHLAAVKGGLNLLEEINKIDVAGYLMEYLHIIKLKKSTDYDGNTINHLATTAEFNEFTYLLTRRGTEVNVLNRHRLTPLGIGKSDNRNSFAQDDQLSLLENAGHKISSQSLLQLLELQNTSTTDISRRSVKNTFIIDMSPFNFLHSKLDNQYHPRHLDHQTEEDLQNTRSRIIIAAVLIATLSFVAGINPPCAVHQEGMTSRNITTAYMVFLLCNNVAFFSSLGITGTLFSTIQCSRSSMIKLLAVSYKIMVVSLSFMVAAYIAAAFMI